ncbi:MAG TPA: hypothetical protein VJG32_23020 [Anaerolineae bacterium]|nr:hypothetical protein [Anaerolineae bacterium]
MNDDHPIQLGKWKILLAFAAGSILTSILARMGVPSAYGISLLFALLLVYWILLGITAGTWIVLGRGWRVIQRDARLRLAFGYFTIAWGALVAISIDTSISTVVFIAPGLAGLVVFAAYLLEGRPRDRDEGEIFP